MDARWIFARPAIPLAVLSAVCAWMVTVSDLQVPACFGVLSATMAVVGLCHVQSHRIKTMLLFIPVWYAVFFLAAISPQSLNAAMLAGKTLWLEGCVVSFTNPYRESGEKESIVLRLDNRLRICVVMDCEGIAYGDKIRILARLDLPSGPTNPGGFDEQSWTSGQGVLLTADVFGSSRAHVLASGSRWSPLYGIWLMRSSFYHTYMVHAGRKNADMLAAFLFGDRSGLADETESAFRMTGLTHILSVSGSHLSLVASPIQFLIGSTGLGKRKKLFFLLAFLTLFAAATGFQPSIVRAMLMMASAQCGKSWKRLPDAQSGLGACVAVMLCVDPWLSRNTGFCISVAATTGIVCLKQPISDRMAVLPRGLRSSLAVALSAQLGSLPILLSRYRRISLLGLPVGLLVMPVVGLLLPAGLLLGIFGSTFASGFLAGVVSTLLKIIMAIVTKAASIRGSYPAVPFWSPLAGVAMWLAFGAVASRGRRTRVLLITASACLAISFCFHCCVHYYFRPDLTVVFADVGQGDSTLIQARDGSSIMIDFGTAKAGAEVVLPLLAHAGVNHLDYGIVTHGHADHAGGFQAVSDVSVVKVLMIPYTKANSFSRDKEEDMTSGLVAAAQSRETDVVQLRAGDHLEIGPYARLQVLHPHGGTTAGNESSLCLLVTCGGFRILIMGDAGLPSEETMTEANLLQDVDVLRVGHHGSDSATGDDFLELVKPEYSIISVGRNFYGHPSESVVNRLKSHGSFVFRTDIDGAVTIKIRNGALRLDSYTGGSLN